MGVGEAACANIQESENCRVYSSCTVPISGCYARKNVLKKNLRYRFPLGQGLAAEGQEMPPGMEGVILIEPQQKALERRGLERSSLP